MTESSAAAVVFSSLEEDLQRADVIQNDVQELRGGLLTRLETMVNSIDFTKAPEKAGEAMAKMQPITTYLTALKDHEKSAQGRASLKLKKKDSDSQNNTAEMIAEFLRTPLDQRAGTIPTVDLEAAAKDVETEIDASDAPVRETETRTSPEDLGE